MSSVKQHLHEGEEEGYALAIDADVEELRISSQDETSSSTPNRFQNSSPPPLFRKTSVQQPQLEEVSVGNWEPVNVLPETPRPNGLSMHISVSWGESIFIFGGYNASGHRVNDFYEFKFSTKTWSLVRFRGSPPSPRDRMGGCVHGNLFYVFGGHDGTSRLGDCHFFDFVSRRWSQVLSTTGQSPTPRHSCCLAAYSDSLFLFGGFDGNYRADVYVLDLSTHKWSKFRTQGNAPSPRYRSTLTLCNDELVVFGGHDGTRHLNDAFALHPETATWRRIQTDTNLPLPRDSHTMCAFGSSLILFGGSSGSALNDLHELNIGTQTWIPLFPGGVPPQPRFCHSMALYHSKILVFGGFDGMNRRGDFLQLSLNVGSLGARVEIPPKTMHLEKMVNCADFADCQFEVADEQVVFAHKLLLHHIPAFGLMFDKQVENRQVGRIKLDGISKDTLVYFLRYLYTEDAEVINAQNVIPLFETADRFGVLRLKALCQNAMMDLLDANNAGSLFAKADLHNAGHLRALAFNYIVNNFDVVSTTHDFEEMGRQRVDLVFEVLKRRGALKF